MNKKLLAIAVGAAMVAGSTAVMADSSVYGKINAGIISYDDGDSDTTNTDGTQSGISIFDEATRLGAKGSSDLGNGLSAIFKLEGTFDLDGTKSSTGFMTNRDSYVGLKGGFGSVVVGRKNTAFKNATGKMDLFADMHGDMTGTGFGNFDQREDNLVQYNGKFGMVSVGVDFQFSEAVDNNIDADGDEEAMGNSIAVGVKPMKGLMVTLASATVGGASDTGLQEASTAQKLGVQWKGGNHTVNVVYKTQSDDSMAADDGQTVTYIQYGMKMGKNAIQFAYQMLDDEGKIIGGTLVNDKLNSTQISAAFVHNFSKSTKAYVGYTAIDNEDNANNTGRLKSAGVALATAAGNDPSGLAVGMTHKF